jgi:hypothetical protein
MAGEHLGARTTDELYRAMLRRAQDDPYILGMYVGGSRGKSAATVHSDYDCDIVVVDERADEYRAQYGGDHSGFNLGVFGLSDFRAYAAIGSDREWDRYNFAHLRATIDKLDGGIQRIIDEKGSLPAEVARHRLPGTLDGYINAVYRSLKNHRDGRELAARLDAAESIPLLLAVAFMLHARLRPYNKYLEWELTSWPLAELPWTTAEFLALLAPASLGEPSAQRAIFRGLRRVASQHGLGAVFASWQEGALRLIEEERP